MDASLAQTAALHPKSLHSQLRYKRLERGRFLWPSPADGAITISPAQLGYLLSGIDWRNPQETWRPTSVG
ncbi:IS66 family insertion sequence element accessory protein TnpB [Bradyrhizobium sp. CCBAU 51753]|uniref:IS66 family insertion sequence element accessory protein TnpB n=1 Tax=Bradyrhizobium sp. CCBAU 51753 TaxID=1325100 RepID=UPI001AEDCB0B|nr:IS66 family insertion sequence element accessory protein TnpB [Bradyrhizobium sp. CCBAU 51753]